jgi:chromosomal replication initiator protein
MPTQDTDILKNYTFKNFVIGPSNKKSYAAALKFTENFGHKSKLLWVHSDAGLGKTHILHAIGNQIIENHPSTSKNNLKIKQIHGHRFVHEYTKAKVGNTLDEFRDEFTALDCLLFDGALFLMRNCHFIEAQIEFYNILRKLLLAKSLIVFEGHTQIENLQQTKLTKLLKKICVQVKIYSSKNYYFKKKIIRQWGITNRYKITDDIISLIAQIKANNIREIHCYAVFISEHCHDLPLTIKEAENLLKKRFI